MREGGGKGNLKTVVKTVDNSTEVGLRLFQSD